MMSALEKAKALKEFRQIRAKIQVMAMSPLEKAKALKRFRELRGMLGGGDAQAGATPQANVASVTASSLNADEMFDPAEIENMRVLKLKSREKLISMKITDFLKMAAEGRDPEKESGINELVASGQKFSDLPFLRGDNDGDVVKITGHEGRHRARKLLEMGYKYMPVVLKINPGKAASIRWDQQADPNRFDYVKQWPTTLEGEHGDTMPFPVTREQAGENYRPAQGDATAAAQAVQQDQPQADAIDTSLLTAIISGQIDTFKDRAKLQELSDALAKAGGDDMPSGEVRDLFENAIRAAGKQVLVGFGYLDAEAA